MSDTRPVIVWFRQDLRLADNPAFFAAANTGAPVVPVYVLDDDNAGRYKIGGASRWWLHQSLDALASSLSGKLVLLRGAADKVLPEFVRNLDASHVFWNRCYEPWRIKRDRQIMLQLREEGRSVVSHGASLLFEPQSVTKKDGTPYKVFTPYYRNCLSSHDTPREPLPTPANPRLVASDAGFSLGELDLMPTTSWYASMAQQWAPGEQGAAQRLQSFLENGLGSYEPGRDRPDRDHVSRLSPHLHYGEMSPHQVWHAVAVQRDTPGGFASVERFRAELGWREFSYYLLYHFPDLPRSNLQRTFDRFTWRDDPADLSCWQQGRTGFPIVDAGMRELWQTGFMHNRVRMITASFLVKNLLLHWHHGADWFWDCLVDADLASNSASWQWVAGCGADAAPYFRVFNPVLQGQKFDPDGNYVRRYVPALARMPAKFIHRPWEASAGILHDAGVTLGDTYPRPIVALPASRERALAAYRSCRSAA